MTVRVDGTKCSGIGLCEMTAPEVFEIGDDGQSHVIGDPDGDRAATLEAISNCPTSAISIDT
ncbi:ferredoxin [Mycolicibacterium sp. P9-22]|uniref:ferredoxin n=1 Tax=Mycolicibacterium sp. P9-22 TaxID=2024613 RepID=UPI0011ED5615|nr:ferredoxin [Mycolicibacterium sp. P9-22]KAA0120577.1 ferredoxin [Mycolicibacterium sp. P9-22]